MRQTGATDEPSYAIMRPRAFPFAILLFQLDDSANLKDTGIDARNQIDQSLSSYIVARDGNELPVETSRERKIIA